jgi:hypothetical protein
VVADVLAEEAILVEAARRMARSAFAKYLHDVIDRVRADGGLTRFQRQLKDSFASFAPDDDTQMYKLFCRIDPIRGAEMHAAVKARVDVLYQTKGATDGLDYGQVVLQALHDLICRQPGDDTDADVGACPEILVICDWQTYLYGQHSATICETSEGIRLPVSFLHDMCAEAMLTVAIAGADGQILQVGTSQRLANREQRRALRAMYRHCAHHGCSVPFDHCRIHHINPWSNQGPTDLDNLIPLCIKHHHLVHEGHWTLTIDPDRTLRWYRPNGELTVTQPFVPLLTPSRSTTADARGSPPTTSGPAPRAGPAPPPTGSLRLFDTADM